MVNAIMAEMPAYMLVFARMAGMLGINPIFSRKNVPAILRSGLILLLTLLIAPGIELQKDFIGFDLALGLIQELLVGLVCGYVFQVFYYMLLLAGDLMDMHFGMSMAKVFDPGTNIQMSISGNILNILFMLYIFASNSHLLLIKIFATSFQIVPAGMFVFSPETVGFTINLFIQIFSLSLRLILPFIVVEFIMDMSMGILMKLIPQIHVFVINIQFKMLLALLMLLMFAVPMGDFLDKYMNLMFEKMQQVLFTLS